MRSYREGRSRVAVEAWWPGAALAAVGVLVVLWPDPGRRSVVWDAGLPAFGSGLAVMLLAAVGLRKVGREEFWWAAMRWLLVLLLAAGALALIGTALRGERAYEKRYPLARATVTDCTQDSGGDNPTYSCVEHVTLNGKVIAERHETDQKYKDDRTVTARVDPVSAHVMSEKWDPFASRLAEGAMLGLAALGIGCYAVYAAQFEWDWFRGRVHRAAKAAADAASTQSVADATPSGAAGP